MGKLKEIAYELTKSWEHMSREDLCEYFGVSDRTLFRYQSKLGLGTNNLESMETTNPIKVFINTSDNKIKNQTFKNWQHFAVWTKAQSHPFVISEGNVINMDYKKVIPEAKKLLAKLS